MFVLNGISVVYQLDSTISKDYKSEPIILDSSKKQKYILKH